MANQLILWKHREHLFVIDGSHRLGALIAWVQDDYGDGERSQRYFGHAIPTEQAAQAERTRRLVATEIGSYRDHIDAARNSRAYGPDIVASSRALGSRTLSLQWVRGDSAKAEQSFIRINQQAATITPQELSLLRGRKRPDVIAARAIIARGAGQLTALNFDSAMTGKIRHLSNEMHSLLFEPELKYPIKSLNLPVGGGVYSASALKMVHDFVTLCVGKISDEDESDGVRTVESINRTKRGAELLCSNKPHSIGLHPAVYFYSWTGKQQPILFLTIAEIIIDLERGKELPFFINLRSRFEDFMISYRTLLNQIVRKFGTKESGKRHLRGFYDEVFASIQEGLSSDEIVERLTANQAYSYLQPTENPYEGVAPTRYSAQVKSSFVISEMLPTAPRCPICGGLVPHQAISIDHKVRREDGGNSDRSNLQISHPYCNTGIKESAVAETARKSG